MVSKKRSQAALEYMMVVFISLLLISGFSYYFFAQKTSYEEDAVRAKVNSIAKRVSQYAEEAAYSTGPYRKTLNVKVPESVQKIYVHDKKYVVFETTQGDSFVYHSNSPVYGYVENSSVHSGDIVVEKVDGQPVICSHSPCECMDNETGYCNDKADNDCDGKVDGADMDCCPDSDGDGYTDIDYAGTESEWCQPPDTFAEDCNGNKSHINPSETEECNDIDVDCDGCGGPNACNDNPLNGNPCKFNCYVEYPPENGVANCSSGCNPLLSTDSFFDADYDLHVEEPAGPNNYQHDLCCDNMVSPNVTLGWNIREGSCNAGEERLISFYRDLPGGSHVDYNDVNNYNDTLCGKVTGFTSYNLSCTTRDTSSGCNADENPIATIQTKNNSHVGAIGKHNLTLCCEVS